MAKVWEIFLSNEQIESLYLCGECPEGVKEAALGVYPRINAAGGLVVSPGGKLLMIHRRGEWDLPKGKQDAGETDEATALREVNEETGAGGLRITAPLCVTYHVDARQEGNYIKRTVWYAMSSDSEMPLAPQADEGIDAAVWLSPDEAWERAQTSYPSIIRVMEAYRSM